MTDPFPPDSIVYHSGSRFWLQAIFRVLTARGEKLASLREKFAPHVPETILKLRDPGREVRAEVGSVFLFHANSDWLGHLFDPM
jgi:hypothetical protein